MVWYIFCTFATGMKRISLILVLFFVCVGICAQTVTRIYNEQIRTLNVERKVLVVDNGVVDGSDPDNTLHISFDEMSHDVHFYTYRISRPYEYYLSSNEYVQGFTTGDITEYEHSINTSREYTHYSFDFPNEDMRLTMSGLYRLYIYEGTDWTKRVAEVDFYVVDPRVQIDARVRANTDIELNGRYQQVDVDVDISALDIHSPDEVRILVVKNNRKGCSISKPTFVEPNRLRFINNKDLIFEGGNEYHHFDAFSCFYAGYGIDRVYHENGDYHVLLNPDDVTNGQYIHEFDSYGRFVVNAERTNNPDTEAEYMWVYWSLPMDKPFFDGALYVDGELFNNELNLRNRMEYDNELKCYWLTSLVKQGGYDYRYVFLPKRVMYGDVGYQPSYTIERVDGSYWQTENEYTIYVFWKPFGARYELLVGVQTKKSTL